MQNSVYCMNLVFFSCTSNSVKKSSLSLSLIFLLLIYAQGLAHARKNIILV